MSTLLAASLIIVASITMLSAGLFFSKKEKSYEIKGSCGGPDINPWCCKKNKSCKK